MPQIDTDVLHKEIDLIQACITRMAHNSFLIKGWAISIVAVVLALVGKGSAPVLLGVIVLIPLISFWYLDAFFLHTEKMYRKMYEWVLTKRREGSEEKLYDLNPTRFKDDVDSRGKIMWSVTLRWFYGIPMILVCLIIGFNVVSPILVRCGLQEPKTALDISSITVENVTVNTTGKPNL